MLQVNQDLPDKRLLEICRCQQSHKLEQTGGRSEERPQPLDSELADEIQKLRSLVVRMRGETDLELKAAVADYLRALADTLSL